MTSKKKKLNLFIRTQYVPMINSVSSELHSVVDNDFSACSDYYKNGIHRGIDIMSKALIVGSLYSFSGCDASFVQDYLKELNLNEY